MPDILFVVPSVEDIYEKPPLGTLLLATILRNNGISSNIFSIPVPSKCADFNVFLDTTVSSILRKEPKIVSFYTRCDAYHIMLKIAEQLKNRQDITIVFGGPQADIVAKETLKAFSYVDYICQGEGETTIVPFFSSLLRGAPDLSVDGLVYKKGDCIVQNSRPVLLHDLDALPDVDYSIIGMSGNHSDTKWFPIDVGRGCPFGCSYCSTNTFWGRKFRLKSPERICEEVKTLHKLYGINSFSFAHDMFTFDRKRIIEVCRLIKKLDFTINWSCSARIDCIDNDLIDCMVDAGMNRMFIGIESGSKRIQKLIHKNLNLDLVMPRLKHIHSKGIHTTVSFIFGFPEETEEDLSQTLLLIGEIAKLNDIKIQTHLCTFLPGTELSVRYNSDMVPAQYLSDITGSAGVRECEDMIRSYPEVFPQFLEYNTQLRTKLEYFPVFILAWLAVQPVYQYLSEKYNKNEIINMYFDFLECNQEMLKRCSDYPFKEKMRCLLENDMLPSKVASQDMMGIINDCYRMAAVYYSPVLETTGKMMQVFSFSPKEFKRGSFIETYKKQVTVAAYSLEKGNRVKMAVKTM